MKFIKKYTEKITLWGLSNSETKILISLLSILIILGTVTFVSHRNSKRIISSSEEIDRSHEIKFRIEQVLQISGAIETGVRGYIITGKEEYLEPANKAIASAFIHLDHLKSLAGSNVAMQTDIIRLSNLVDKKISSSMRGMEVRREKGLEAATLYVSEGRGKILMDQIRELSDKMLLQQDNFLAEEKALNRESIRNFNISFDLLLVKIAVTVITVTFVLRYYFRSRRKSEEIIRENQELLQSIMNNTTSLIFIRDLAGRYLMVNRQWSHLFNLTTEEVIHKTDREIFPKEFADEFRSSDLEVIREQRLMEFDVVIPHNGEEHHYLSIKFPLFDKNHHMYAVCGIATNITERKLYEEQLKSNTDTILDLFNNAPCGYQSTDRNGIIVEMNDTELKWLGYTRQEVIGKMHASQLLTTDSMNLFHQHFPNLIERKYESVRDVEANFIRKDGSIFPVLANSIALYDEHGEFIRTRTALFDISVLKQAETIYSRN